MKKKLKEIRISCRVSGPLKEFVKARVKQYGLLTEKQYVVHLATLDGYTPTAKDC